MAGNNLIRRIGVVLRWCTCVFSLLAFFALLFAEYFIRGGGILQVCAGIFLAIFLLMVWEGSRAERIRQRMFILSLGLFTAFAIVEGYVRLFDPFPVILRGGRINLPVHVKTVFSGHGVAGLDEQITVSFNSLGFRGPEPPADWKSQLTILCVGGSTTQCYYLSDGKTWPDRLSKKLSGQFDRVWVNNAGLDGHSTFGHLHLVDQYVSAIRPRVVLLFVGINDIGRADLSRFDGSLHDEGYAGESLGGVINRRLSQHFDSYALLDNLRRQDMARSRGLTHQVGIGHLGLGNNKKVAMSDELRSKTLQEHDARWVQGYQQRLTQLITKCRDAGSRVVLITQPVLYGEGKDDVRGIDLERVRIGEVDGWTQWRLLQQYNEATITVGNDLHVPVIAVAESMPKSSRYYYDFVHYSNDGAERLATLIEEDLAPLLREWYPDLSKL
jgi:lysophospholipase L1-like esterase